MFKQCEIETFLNLQSLLGVNLGRQQTSFESIHPSWNPIAVIASWSPIAMAGLIWIPFGNLTSLWIIHQKKVFFYVHHLYAIHTLISAHPKGDRHKDSSLGFALLDSYPRDSCLVKTGQYVSSLAKDQRPKVTIYVWPGYLSIDLVWTK